MCVSASLLVFDDCFATVTTFWSASWDGVPPSLHLSAPVRVVSLLADIAKVPEKQSAAALAIRRLRDMNISMDALYSATQATAALKSERRNVQTNAANLDTRAENLAYVLRKIVETERAHKGLPAPVSLNLESNLRAPRPTPF